MPTTMVVETDGRQPDGVAWAGRYASRGRGRLVVAAVGGPDVEELMRRVHGWVDAVVPVTVPATTVVLEGDPEAAATALLRQHPRPLACVAWPAPDSEAIEIGSRHGLLGAALAAGVAVVVVPHEELEVRAVTGASTAAPADPRPRYVVLAQLVPSTLTVDGLDATVVAVAWAVEEAESTRGSVLVAVDATAVDPAVVDGVRAELAAALTAFAGAGVDIEICSLGDAELGIASTRGAADVLVVAATDPSPDAAASVLAAFPSWSAGLAVVLVPAAVRATIAAC